MNTIMVDGKRENIVESDVGFYVYGPKKNNETAKVSRHTFCNWDLIKQAIENGCIVHINGHQYRKVS